MRLIRDSLVLILFLCSTWALPAQVVNLPVRAGFRNELTVPVLIRDLTQPLTQPIRLGPKETVWDRLPAGARIPVAVTDALTGQVLAKTILIIPPKGTVLFCIQMGPTGNVTIMPQPLP
ncbi:MAG: hypothetical protein RMI91_03260 [Gemmatales bacterium]|nr:hypothetical protein [Gemmatales bacterium]MDW7993649.1 hypothetical protein [Gemmatales bacterium]